MDDGYAYVTEASATYTSTWLLHLEIFEDTITVVVWRDMREGPKL
jgi:hypothetical protein